MSEWENLPKNFSGLTGFVYIIINLHTDKKYIGQKKFWKQVTKPPLKGRVNKRRSLVESDWRSYYGSNQKLLDDLEALGKHKFRRVILVLCGSKAEMNYEETRLQFEHQVLLSRKWYNAMINCRISSNQLSEGFKK